MGSCCAAWRGAGLGWEVHVGENIGFGIVHQGGEFWNPWPGLIGNLAPLLAGGFGIVLGEGGADPGGDDAPLGLAGIGQRVAHEMNPTALPGGAEYLADRGLQPLVRIGDDELNPAQTPPRKAAQELDPEGFGLATRARSPRAGSRRTAGAGPSGRWC